MTNDVQYEESSSVRDLTPEMEEILLSDVGNQENAGRSFEFPECSQVVMMALGNDYLDTKHALIAMTRAFKKYMEFAAKHDSYLIGQIGDEEWGDILRQYAVSDHSDVAELSRWMDVALRDSGVVAYADELAIMFDVSEEQALLVLTGLEQQGILHRATS